MKKDLKVEPGFLIPVIKRILKLLSFASIYEFIFRVMRKANRWQDEECIRFWFAEAYVLVWFFVLALAFCLVSVQSRLWYFFLILVGYRLFDLGQFLASTIVFTSRRRQDNQGGYILARDPIRWVLLTLINLSEIVLYFSFAYLTWGTGFEPSINSRISAIHQSLTTFFVGGGSTPTSDLAYVIVILQLCYFVFFLIVVVPVVLSLIRAKERTTEVLGEDVEPDKRI